MRLVKSSPWRAQLGQSHQGFGGHFGMFSGVMRMTPATFCPRSPETSQCPTVQ